MVKEHYPGEKRIAYPEQEPLDAFGRVRVAHPFRDFDIQFNYGLHPRLFEQLNINGNVTHIPFSSIARLSTGGTATGNRSIFQSKEYFRYLPGLSQQIVWTCILGEKKNNVRRIIGYIDDNDGLAFIQNPSSLGILRRTSTSGSAINNIVPQSEWNIDGLGDLTNSKNPSGIELKESKNNIFIIDFQWLSAGRIRWGFDFGGHITYVHQEQFANTEIVPFMRTANLPFRVEILNTGIADSETSLDFICLSINSEGGSAPVALPGHINNAIATNGDTPFRSVGVGSPLPVLSIRPRATFKDLINRGQVRPIKCEATSKDAPVYYSVILNGILTGSSFVNANTDNSNVEVDVSATAISGGIVVGGGYVGGVIGAQGLGIDELDLDDIILSNNIVGDSTDILSIVIGLAGGVSSDCAGEFKWGELR